MTKQELTTKIIEREVWTCFKKAYRIQSEKPHSEAQLALLKEVSNMVYEKFAQHVKIAKLQETYSELAGQIDETDGT